MHVLVNQMIYFYGCLGPTLFTQLSDKDRPLDRSVLLKIIFSNFSFKKYVVGTEKNCLNEMILLSTGNIVKTGGLEIKTFTISQTKFLFILIYGQY